MSVVSVAMPLDGITVYPSGVYAQREGHWFATDTQSAWPPDSVILGVLPGERVPGGFIETPEHETFSAMLTVPDHEIDAVCALESTCTWKNFAWVIEGLDRSERVATLSLQRSDVDNRSELASWPGIVATAESVIARVRPGEMAQVHTKVTPYDTAPSLRRRDELTISGVPVASLADSPRLPADTAVQMVRDMCLGEEMGAYPVGELRADRMRDGWRVWALPERTDDPLGFRMGWAVWYVADDAVMWRSSTSTEFTVAARRMSDQLYQRLQIGRAEQ